MGPRDEAAKLWLEIEQQQHSFETRMEFPRDNMGYPRMDQGILVRPQDKQAAHLLELMELDTPERFLALYGKDLGEVPVIGKVRSPKLPMLGLSVNKTRMITLAAGFAPEVQVGLLEEMRLVENAFWSSPAVTWYLAERRSGGLKEIPPALLARRSAVRVALDYIQRRGLDDHSPVRVGGIGVGSADELVQIGSALQSQAGIAVEVRAIELNGTLVQEANQALQSAGISGQVIQGSMSDPDQLKWVLDLNPSVLVDHWAGCYTHWMIQRARYAFIGQVAPRVAIVTGVITDQWGVLNMIRGELARNRQTAARLNQLQPLEAGIHELDGEGYFVYPGQVERFRRVRGPWAVQRLALYGWLNTLLPKEVRLGPVRAQFPDGQDALRISAPYGAGLQVRTCRYSLPRLRNCAETAGWTITQEIGTLFGCGAIFLLEYSQAGL